MALELFGFVGGSALAFIASLVLVGAIIITALSGGAFSLITTPVIIASGLILVGTLIGFGSLYSIIDGIFGGNLTTVIIVVGVIVFGIFIIKGLFGSTNVNFAPIKK